MDNYYLNVFKKAALCRSFEQYVYKGIENKLFKFPIYLSAGQEYIASSIFTVLEDKNINPDIFIQHRGHSTYLASGAPIKELIDELLGRESGCAHGMGGSASIQSKPGKIFGESVQRMTGYIKSDTLLFKF